MPLPNMKSYTQAVVRPMMKALESMYAADVKYMEELTSQQVDELKKANAKMLVLTDLVEKLQLTIEEYEEELVTMRKKLTANEAIKQLTSAFYRLLQHNNRIFALEAEKYQVSRKMGKIEMEKGVQDQRIARLTTDVRTATNAANNAVAIVDARLKDINNAVESSSQAQMLTDTKLFTKLLENNNRVFQLERQNYDHSKVHDAEALAVPDDSDTRELNTRITALTAMVNQLNDRLAQIG